MAKAKCFYLSALRHDPLNRNGSRSPGNPLTGKL